MYLRCQDGGPFPVCKLSWMNSGGWNVPISVNTERQGRGWLWPCVQCGGRKGHRACLHTSSPSVTVNSPPFNLSKCPCLDNQLCDNPAHGPQSVLKALMIPTNRQVFRMVQNGLSYPICRSSLGPGSGEVQGWDLTREGGCQRLSGAEEEVKLRQLLTPGRWARN